eukprot:11189616-Lingulodinium_polyedra.AAC.1
MAGRRPLHENLATAAENARDCAPRATGTRGGTADAPDARWRKNRRNRGCNCRAGRAPGCNGADGGGGGGHGCGGEHWCAWLRVCARTWR